jgi:hypothetical protein
MVAAPRCERSEGSGDGGRAEDWPQSGEEGHWLSALKEVAFEKSWEGCELAAFCVCERRAGASGAGGAYSGAAS